MVEVIVVDMICKINPLFNDMIVWSEGSKKKFLYSQLIKAIYRTLLGVLIFYNKLSKHLTNHIFTKNKYDICTFNRIVNSEQMIVQLYVDNLKLSHKDQDILDDYLDELRCEFGQEDK